MQWEGNDESERRKGKKEIDIDIGIEKGDMFDLLKRIFVKCVYFDDIMYRF